MAFPSFGSLRILRCRRATSQGLSGGQGFMDVLAARRKSIKAKIMAGDDVSVKDAQLAFFERVREYGYRNAGHIESWRQPLPRRW